MARVARFTQGDQNPVSMMIASMLTESQFQELNGSNWVLADGRSVAGSRYATITGNTNAPDLRGRVLVGKDDMGGTAANRLTISGSGINGTVLGAVGGAETHVLTSGQMPSHTHTIGQQVNIQNLVAGTNGVVYTGTNSLNSGSAGSGQAHNNTQPSFVANVFIKIN